jgi:dephospho-CoA kinase
MDDSARLVIVTGPPAAGKTTVATFLADRLGLPLLGMDTIKEALFEHIGAASRAESEQLGRAAFRIQIDLAHDLARASVSLVLEAAVDASESDQLLNLVQSFPSRAVHVAVHAAASTRLERHAARVRTGERHRAHQITDEAEATDWAEQGVPEHTVPDLACPLIEVDTSSGSFPMEPLLVAVQDALAPRSL